MTWRSGRRPVSGRFHVILLSKAGSQVSLALRLTVVIISAAFVSFAQCKCSSENLSST